MNERFQTIKLDVQEHVATITLNRPESLNAMSTAMFQELEAAIQSIDLEPGIFVTVLTGAGRAFSVGADLKERQSMSDADLRHRRAVAPRTLGAIARARRPVLAAVNGMAFGGGFELALACDIIVAARSASFAQLETTIGVIPAGGATQRLPRLIGTYRAKELIFTGRKISADDAYELGLLNRVVPDADLLQQTLTIAGEIKRNAPIAVAQAKRAINASMSVGIDVGLEYEADAYQACVHSKDRQEGLAAFREKRQPNYTGE